MTTAVFKNKDEWRNFWLECYKNRYVDSDGIPIPVDVGPGSYPWIRASALADVLSLQSSTAAAIGEGHLLDNLVGDQLDNKFGATIPRIKYARASGVVTVEAGSAGTTILAGDTLVSGQTGVRYRYTGGDNAFSNGTGAQVESIDYGVGQDLQVGSVLSWETVRAGCYATCKVADSGEGKGIYGGRDRESDEEYRDRIRFARANPEGGGNEGELLALLEESSPNDVLGRPGHGVPVEKGFVYPAIHGPGTCGLAFIVKGDSWHDSRVPSSGQLSTVFAYVSQYASARDMLFLSAIVTQPLKLDFSVELNEFAAQWTDFDPWPSFRQPGAGQVIVGSVTDALNFTLICGGGVYTEATAPSANTTIALYDSTRGIFRKKKIQSVSGSGPWSVSCYGSIYSDTSYVPVQNQRVSPWFDAIDSVVASVGEALARFGQGEMTAIDPGDGRRMRRVPAPTMSAWPTKVTGRLGYKIESDVSSVDAATLLYASATDTLPGYGTALTYRVQLTDVSITKA